MKFPSLVCEIWCSQGFWVIAWCDLDLWPFNLMSMSQAVVHMWPNSGEISSNIYVLYSSSRLWSLLAVTLTFNLLTPKTNQHTYKPKYICDQNWVKFHSLVLEILCSQSFWVTACHDFDLWPQNIISTYTNHYASVTKIGWNSPHWFLIHGVHKVFMMHRLTHSLTHTQMDILECSTPMAPFFNGARGIKHSKQTIRKMD